jgi:hypothetical protein
MMLVKQIQSGVYYCRFLETGNDPACDDPTMMDYDKYNKWRRNGQAVYQASLNPPGTVIAPPSIGSTTAAYVSATQKDDDAALISWNRKPRDIIKYAILKTDAGYPDWRLKMKRQLIADTLQRVMDPTFKIATSCRLGSDKELGELQINFFEQILSPVLLNPKGKGLVTTHPEDALYVWKEHEAHQNMSDSAQISTTALMNKLMSLKIANSPTRHAFLISFQDLCNRYDQLTDTKLDNSFKRTLLQASIVHDTALLNSWNTVNEVKRAQNPGMPVTVTYSEYFSFLINQSKTHDIATPFKRGTRHAHKANFDSFSDGNDEENNNDDSVLDKVIAHMSIQNKPMSKETVNALQVFSTFQ